MNLKQSKGGGIDRGATTTVMATITTPTATAASTVAGIGTKC